jgi:phospholipid transport system substrate-binding protein
VAERVGRITLLAALVLTRGAWAQTFAGNEIVAATSAEIAETIEARRAELEADPRAIAEVVDTLILPRFDMQRGTRAILDEHWRSATTVERDRFAAAFYNYLVATYGDALLYFKPDTVRVLPFRGDPADQPAHVRTIVTLNDGTEVDVEFLMIGRDSDWQVVDVVAEGVSYVRTYRSQFRVDIATEGLASVIEWLEAKAATSAADAASSAATTPAAAADPGPQ